jgi:hypothetical protein
LINAVTMLIRPPQLHVPSDILPAVPRQLAPVPGRPFPTADPAWSESVNSAGVPDRRLARCGSMRPKGLIEARRSDETT